MIHQIVYVFLLEINHLTHRIKLASFIIKKYLNVDVRFVCFSKRKNFTVGQLVDRDRQTVRVSSRETGHVLRARIFEGSLA